jgi:hypothetical protein
MRFQPGVSGNPGGRPRALVEVEALAREHSVAAIERLVDLMSNSLSDAVRLAAANSLLDRALGKPRQAVAAILSGDVRQMTDAMLLEIIAGGAPALPAPGGAEKIVDEAA